MLAESGRRAEAEQETTAGYDVMVRSLGKDHWRVERTRKRITELGFEVP